MASDHERVEQIYVTHCLPSESVQGRPGFQARASSTDDVSLQDFARDKFYYDLPAGLNCTAAEQAPCRLALAPVPGRDRLWALTRSVLTLGDTRGRRYSFFSHVVFTPPLTLCQALRCWGAPHWQGEYPAGPTKIDALANLTSGALLTDDVLHHFLQGTLRIADATAWSLCPPRLEALAPTWRRQLLWTVLKGVRLALHPLTRFYLVGESGLVALLLYGVARLLPEARDVPLSFNTYELNNLSLREYQLTQVVGVHGSDKAARLDPEYFSERGVALNTFTGELSEVLRDDWSDALAAQLRGGPPVTGPDEWPEEFANRLLGLGLKNRWELLDNTWTRMRDSTARTVNLEAFDRALVAEELFERFLRGQADVAVLLELANYPDMRARLGQHSALVWDKIEIPSLTIVELRQESLFADVLRQYKPTLVKRAAVVAGADWQAHWRRCQDLYPEANEQRGLLEEILQQAVTDGTWLPKRRTEMLSLWLRLGGTAGALKPVILSLLQVATDAELHELASVKNPELPAALLARAMHSRLLSRQGAPAYTLGLLAHYGKALKTEFRTLVLRPGDPVQDVVWNELLEGAPLAELFAKLLHDRKAELQRLLGEVVVGARSGKWSVLWPLYIRAFDEDASARVAAYGELVKQATGVQLDLLRGWREIAPGQDMPPELRARLLQPRSPGEVDSLMALGLTPGDQEFLVFAALQHSETADRARAIVLESEELFARVAQRLDTAEPTQRRDLLRALLKDCEPESPTALTRLLTGPPRLKPELLEAVLESVAATLPKWGDYWGSKKMLGLALQGQPIEDERLLKVLWGFLGMIDRRVIVPDDATKEALAQHTAQAKILHELVTTCGRSKETPASADYLELRGRLAAWDRLYQRVWRTSSLGFDPETQQEVEADCKQLELEFPTLLAALAEFLRQDKTKSNAAVHMLRLFLLYYEPTDIRARAKELGIYWLKLMRHYSPDEREKGDYGFLTHLIPDADVRLEMAEGMVAKGYIKKRIKERLEEERRPKASAPGLAGYVAPAESPPPVETPPPPEPEETPPAQPEEGTAAPGWWKEALVGAGILLTVGILIVAVILLRRTN